MQKNDIQNRIVETLKQSIRWAQMRESKVLKDILKLERKLNNLQDTKKRARKKQQKQFNKQQQQYNSQQTVAAQSQKRIDELIAKAEQQINELQNPNKKNKINSANNLKTTKNVQPLPQIEKKPPVPTANRAKDPHNMVPKVNYHYRNKNQVTGKITETPVIRSGSKAHNSTSMSRKEESNTIFQNYGSVQKQKNVVVQNITVVKPQQPVSKPVGVAKTPIIPKNQNQKEFFIDFCSFKTPIRTLVQNLNEKQTKKVSLKRPVIENLISQYNKNQMGYKQNQAKAMSGFVNQVNKLGAVRARLPQNGDLKIQSRYWEGHIQTFNFKNLIYKFYQLLQTNPVSEQYAPDAKTTFKIRLWHQRINQLFQQHLKSTIQNFKAPPKLGINFTMNSNKPNETQYLQQSQKQHLQNPYRDKLYQVLMQQLQELKSLQSFDRESLSKLRVLVSIGIYGGRRSPVVVEMAKFGDWIQYYNQ